jgi:type IV fimbrial biogenesis protein FimT
MNATPKLGKQRGFSLIEMVMSAAVASVLASAAVPGMMGTMHSIEVTSTTNELVTALHLARSEAATRRTRVAVSPNAGADWRTGWIVYVDRNDDGVFDAGSDELVRTFQPVSKQMQITAHFGATSDGSALSYTADGVLRRPGSQGLLIGRLTLAQGDQARSICAATMRLRTVKATTCS